MVEDSTYIDVNIFVYWLGNHPKFGETAYKWIKKIENTQRQTYITSSLTLYETLVILAGLTGKTLKDKTFTEKVITAITNIKNLTIDPLKPEDFTNALEAINDYKLDYEDAIHLAAAIRTGAQEIISNNKDFDNTPIKRNL
jgi:uncharacterized protein